MVARDSPPGPVLAETWHVVRTSLPFWRSRTDPTITYAPLPGGAVLDAVRYRRRGRERLVLGVDRPDPDVPDGWVWRGRDPLTRLTTSRWRVLGHGDGWAVTWFARTPFTPEGVDVYARTPRPDDAVVAEALAALDASGTDRALLDALFVPEVTEAG